MTFLAFSRYADELAVVSFVICHNMLVIERVIIPQLCLQNPPYFFPGLFFIYFILHCSHLWWLGVMGRTFGVRVFSR